jgi:hypothetical protein
LEGGAIHRHGKGTLIGFDMSFWTVKKSDDVGSNPEFPDHCGTAMCIGGAAIEFFGGSSRISYDLGEDETIERAAHILGLDILVARDLFFPWGKYWYESAESPPLVPSYMAGVLRRLIETGKLVG